MTAILLVKTSSLGDVVHNLPVVADIRAALGDVAVDWVVERAFAAVPRLHPGVRDVIECDLRHWRRSWWRASTCNEWRRFMEQLRSRTYDAIVDTQGLLKSAILARLARGLRHGLDWRSSREPLRCFYDRVYSVPRSAHAVLRNRRLCALALGYEPQVALHYGLEVRTEAQDFLRAQPFVVFLHATSDASKYWPQERWRELGCRYAAAGFRVLLPWGSDAECERAQRIAADLPQALVPEHLALDAMAALLSRAHAVIGVDTGLTHLAAALDRPVVGIYGVTSPSTTGVYAGTRAVNVGSGACFPDVDEVVAALVRLGVAPNDSRSAGAA